MRDTMCPSKTQQPTFANLKEELNSIKIDVHHIEIMEVSEESKIPILEELQKQINEVKEKMHDYIDAL